MLKVSVIVPAYNEEKTILEVLTKVKAESVPGAVFEVIVVDDGSKDKTVALLEQNTSLYTRLIKMPKNGGKGAAVREGIKAATGDYVLFQDADLEYDPSDYGKLLLPVLRFDADVVMGSRFMAPAYMRVVYFWHKMGNLAITLVFNLLNNTTYSDIYTCYLLYRRKLLTAEELRTDGWDQQAEILTLASSRGKILYEVPISYHGRTYAEGKKIRWYHTIAVFKAIFLTKLRAALAS